jgi:pimeloyl-ACP methyl ester carboxylesterase
MAAHTFALSDRVIEAGLERAYFDDSRVTPELVRSYAERLRIEGVTDAFHGLVGPSSEPPFRIDLAAIRTPALVVWGAEDELIEAEAARKRSSELPNSRFVSLPACGHTPMEECPEAFLAAALPFLVAEPTADASAGAP